MWCLGRARPIPLEHPQSHETFVDDDIKEVELRILRSAMKNWGTRTCDSNEACSSSSMDSLVCDGTVALSPQYIHWTSFKFPLWLRMTNEAVGSVAPNHVFRSDNFSSLQSDLHIILQRIYFNNLCFPFNFPSPLVQHIFKRLLHVRLRQDKRKRVANRWISIRIHSNRGNRSMIEMEI